MTYFLSVSSAVVNKRSLTKSIYNLGKNPQKIAEKFFKLNPSYSHQQLLKLQEMVDRHSVNHQAYPVVHFYNRSKPKDCFSINIAGLDEGISILLYSGKGDGLQEELEPLRISLTNFLENLEKNFSRSLPQVEQAEVSLNFSYTVEGDQYKGLQTRRRILQRLLKSEGFQWEDVM